MITQIVATTREELYETIDDLKDYLRHAGEFLEKFCNDLGDILGPGDGLDCLALARRMRDRAMMAEKTVEALTELLREFAFNTSLSVPAACAGGETMFYRNQLCSVIRRAVRAITSLNERSGNEVPKFE